MSNYPLAKPTAARPTAGFPRFAETHERQIKIERFVTKYVETLKLSQAYKDAFLVEDTTYARNAAKALLAIPVVRDEVDRRINNKQVLAEITAERINIELAKMAFADPRKLFKTVVETDKDGNTTLTSVLRQAHELDADIAAAITGVNMTQTGKISMKMVDKRAALMDLAKLNGLLVDKKEIKHTLVQTDDLTPEELDEIEALERGLADGSVIDVTPDDEDE